MTRFGHFFWGTKKPFPDATIKLGYTVSTPPTSTGEAERRIPGDRAAAGARGDGEGSDGARSHAMAATCRVNAGHSTGIAEPLVTGP